MFLLGLFEMTQSLFAAFLYLALGAYMHATLFRKTGHSPVFFSFLSIFIFGFICAIVFHGMIAWSVFFIFALLLFLLWGIRTSFFVNHRLYGNIFYFIFIFAIVACGSAILFRGWWLIAAFMFLAIFAATRDYLFFFNGSHTRQTRAFSILLSFLLTEECFIASLLSIGSLNVASLAMILALTILDAYLYAENGILTKRVLIKDTVLFFVLSSVVILVPLIFSSL